MSSMLLSELYFENEYNKEKLNPEDALGRLEPKVVASIQRSKQVTVFEKVTQKKLIEDYHIEIGMASAGNLIHCISQKYKWKGMFLKPMNSSANVKSVSNSETQWHITIL